MVRKGGIREKAFAVPQTRFLLLPGYEHQRPELLKEEYRGLMDEIPDLADDGPLRFSSFAEVEGAYEISEAEELAALDPHHMWTPEYAESRFKWRPKKPLTVLVLRTYLLPEDGRASLQGRVRGMQVLDRAAGTRLCRRGAARALRRGLP